MNISIDEVKEIESKTYKPSKIRGRRMYNIHSSSNGLQEQQDIFVDSTNIIEHVINNFSIRQIKSFKW